MARQRIASLEEKFRSELLGPNESRVIVGRPSGSSLPSDDGISDHILALDVVRGEHCVSYHIEAFHVLERTPISNEFNRSRDRE